MPAAASVAGSRGGGQVSAFTHSFASWDEFVSAADRPTYRGFYGSSRLDKGNDWSGSATWNEALAIARRERPWWPDGADAIASITERVAGAVALPRYTPVDAPALACAYDPGAVIAGDPDCWLEPEFVPAPASGAGVISIVANISASSGISSGVITRRGIAIAALVVALERSGRAVTLDIADAGTRIGPYERSATRARIHASGAGEIDQRLAVLALTWPGVLRRLWFSLCDQDPAAAAISRAAYGVPADTPEGERGDIYIPRMHLSERQWNTPESAVAWVIDTLAAQGVELVEPGAR